MIVGVISFQGSGNSCLIVANSGINAKHVPFNSLVHTITQACNQTER